MLDKMKTSFSNYLKYEKVRHYLDIINFAYAKLSKEVKDNLGISLKEAKFLLQVNINSRTSLTKIQNRMYLPSSTAAWLADRLVQKGLLIRKQNPQNRREVILELSKDGMNILQKIDEVFFPREVQQRLASVPEKTVADIEQGLQTLCRLYGEEVE